MRSVGLTPRAETPPGHADRGGHAGKPQVIVPGTNRLRATTSPPARYLECGGCCPTSSRAGRGQRLVYAGSRLRHAGDAGHPPRRRPLDITGTNQVVWTRKRDAYPSPLLYATRSTTCSTTRRSRPAGIKTGEDKAAPPARLDHGRLRLPVGAANRVYITSREGVTQVMSHGEPTPRCWRQPSTTSSAPRPPGRPEFYLRGEKHSTDCGGVGVSPRAKGSTADRSGCQLLGMATWAVSPGKPQVPS